VSTDSQPRRPWLTAKVTAAPFVRRPCPQVEVHAALKTVAGRAQSQQEGIDAVSGEDRGDVA